MPIVPKKFKNVTTGSVFTPEQVEDMIEAIKDNGRSLTDWEEQFARNMSEQFDTFRTLSPAQLIQIERIYSEKVP